MEEPVSMPSSFLKALVQALGPSAAEDLLLTHAEDLAPFLEDRTGQWPGHAMAVALPRCTQDVAAIVRAAAQTGCAVVPQGGNTGLTGGSAGEARGPGILLSLRRMRSIRSFEPDTPALIAEAGCVLGDVQAFAAEHELQIPLGLGSEGSATVGGLISTNAGGIRALRHGVTRSQVLGLEVVLSDGRVWNGLRTVLKNNMGYDLKHLFIGAEGTLGIVTAAALKLAPTWRRVETALVALQGPGDALRLLSRLRHAIGDVIVACELMQQWGIELGVAAVPGTTMPLSPSYPWYVLVEAGTAGAGETLREELEAALAPALEDGLAGDAIIAESEAQRSNLWHLREALVDGKRRAGLGVNVDVAVPPGLVGTFIEEGSRVAAEFAPGSRTLAFGHVGDGNVHFSVHMANGVEEMPVAAVTAAVHALALSLGGSICAEHGVGRKMRQAVSEALDPVELDLLGTLKRALDPQHMLNPGAVVVRGTQGEN